ncbi:tetratricopeptide repeat protein [Luteolibacter yonseiensis]|uniref:Tetratricopeptide repeat protein n=1 Tax=Luteolibacter yonseiensis TaxID=1144680 RepID=A0A934VA98_9BACT|nr:tetratricopeptide repeat protein [Luteolibacter yonseiensis]MBK1815993.1 tetratricopeptide repeat protein [Luteolibacter yonseiensis]
MKLVTGIACILGTALPGAVDPRVEFAFGVLEEQRGMDSAPEHFEKARLADPLAVPLVERGVSRRLEAGDRAAAVKLFRDLATARPDDLEVQLLFADFLTQQGKGDSLATKLATDALENALKKNAGNPQVIQRLHPIYQAANRTADAAALLDLLTPDDPESALLYASLSRSVVEGEEDARRGKLDRHYLSATAAHPEDATLARAASEYFRESGRMDLAVSLLEKHVAAAPASLGLRTRLGVLYFAAQQDEKGIATLKEVLEINPQQSLAHQALAKFHRSHGNPELARYHSSELLKLRGGSADEFLKLGEEWLAADDPRAARLLLERAVFQYPDHFELLQKLAIATRRDPETRENAARLFREAEAAQPETVKNAPAFLVESAETLIAQGQGKAAEERLRTAIKAYPPDARKETASALRRLAELWEKENRNLDAAKSLRQRADGLDP